MEENKQQLSSEKPILKEKIQTLLNDFDKMNELFNKGELKIEGKENLDYIEDVCKPTFLKIFKLTVPSYGKSDTKLGEIARCIYELWYHYSNKGEVYFVGNGIETIGSFASYLEKCDIKSINEIMDELRYIHEIECKDDYIKLLSDLTKEFLLGISDNIDRLLDNNTVDSSDHPKYYNLVEEKFETSIKFIIVPVNNPYMAVADGYQTLVDPIEDNPEGNTKLFDSPQDAFDYIDNRLSNDSGQYYAVRSIYFEEWMGCLSFNKDDAYSISEKEMVRRCNRTL